MTRTFGSKYKKGMTPRDASTRAREDILVAIRNGKLPENLKVAVRLTSWKARFEINTAVTQCPFPVLNPERIAAEQAGRPDAAKHLFYNADARKLLRDLLAMVEVYNYRGESKSDVFFEPGVGFAPELVAAEKAALIAGEPLTAEEPEPESGEPNELEAFLESAPDVPVTDAKPARKQRKVVDRDVKPAKARKPEPAPKPAPRERARRSIAPSGMGNFLTQALSVEQEAPETEPENAPASKPRPPQPDYWY